MLKRNWIWIAGLTALIVGCSSSTETPKDTADNGAPTAPKTTGTPPPSTTGTAPTTAASYSAVQAIFTSKCAGCHGATNPKAGINLTSYETAMKGGMEGPIITAGDPDHSKIVDALRGRNGAKQMPMKAAALPEDQIKTIEDWIKAGAKSS
jgi:mono/diheme cytochrome c family protein